MTQKNIQRVAWTGIVSALLGLSVGYYAGSLTDGIQCRSVPCAYRDQYGVRFDGICGSRSADERNCYCFKKEDPASTVADERWASHIQAACEER